jgi:hypothetical protein
MGINCFDDSQFRRFHFTLGWLCYCFSSRTREVLFAPGTWVGAMLFGASVLRVQRSVPEWVPEWIRVRAVPIYIGFWFILGIALFLISWL